MREALERTAEKAGVVLPPDRAETFAREWWEFERAVLRTLRPDALPVLRQIRDADYLTALITNCPPDIPVLWSASELTPLFDVAVLSSVAGLRKSDPRIYRLACK